MRIAVDTCVLAYAEGVGDEPRCTVARDVIAGLPLESVLLPVQVLGELHRVLMGKTGRGAVDARNAILSWADAFAIGDSTWSSMESAIDLAADHGLRIWDALILSVAAEQKCRLLLSEDFQNGFTWRGVTVVNPFFCGPSSTARGIAAARNRQPVIGGCCSDRVSGLRSGVDFTLGYSPERINDGMGAFIANRTIREMTRAGHPVSGMPTAAKIQPKVHSTGRMD